MRERLQLSLRFDDRRELLEAVKKQAKLSGMSLTDFVCAALENALSEGLALRQSRQDNDKADTFLSAKITGIEEQVSSHNNLIEDLQTRFENLQTDLLTTSGEPAPTPTDVEAIAQKVLERLTSYAPVTVTDLENLKQRIHTYDINRQADRRNQGKDIEGLQNATRLLFAKIQDLSSHLAVLATAIASLQLPVPTPPTDSETEKSAKKSPKRGRGRPPSASSKPDPNPLTPPIPTNWEHDAERFLNEIENWQHNEWVLEDEEDEQWGK